MISATGEFALATPLAPASINAFSASSRAVTSISSCLPLTVGVDVEGDGFVFDDGICIRDDILMIVHR